MRTLLGTDPTTVAGGESLVVLTRAALRVAAPIAAVLVLGSFALRGLDGGVTALVAAVVLVGLHVGSGRASARIAGDNVQLLPALTMVALLLRLTVYGVAIIVFDDVAGVDVPVLATTVVGLTLAILVTETLVVARYSKFWWTSPATTTEVAEAAVGKDRA